MIVRFEHNRDFRQLSCKQSYCRPLPTEGNTLLVFDEIKRIVIKIRTRAKASITAYSATSCPSSLDQEGTPIALIFQPVGERTRVRPCQDLHYRGNPRSTALRRFKQADNRASDSRITNMGVSQEKSSACPARPCPHQGIRVSYCNREVGVNPEGTHSD